MDINRKANTATRSGAYWDARRKRWVYSYRSGDIATQVELGNRTSDKETAEAAAAAHFAGVGA